MPAVLTPTRQLPSQELQALLVFTPFLGGSP